MVHPAVCLERHFIIHDATLDQVVDACEKAFKEMKLKVTEEKSVRDGKITVLAKEGALLPLTIKTLLFPFSISNYIKSAQRSGVHVLISPAEEGIHLHSCGIALDETTGDLAKYSKEDLIEEVTTTMEAMDFENNFLKKIFAIFPKVEEKS